MSRAFRIAVLILAVAFTPRAFGEIVKVTAERTTLYDGETKKSRSVKIQGKRFLVYSATKDWYLVGMTIRKEAVLRWIPRADVVVDWGKTKSATA